MGSATRWRRWTRRLPGRAGAGVAHPSPRGGTHSRPIAPSLPMPDKPGPLRARSPRGTAAAGPGHDHRSASTPLPARRHRPRRLLARIPPRRHPCHQARRMGLAPGAWRALALQGRHVAAGLEPRALPDRDDHYGNVPHPTAATTANTAAEPACPETPSAAAAAADAPAPAMARPSRGRSGPRAVTDKYPIEWLAPCRDDHRPAGWMMAAIPWLAARIKASSGADGRPDSGMAVEAGVLGPAAGGKRGCRRDGARAAPGR